MDNKKLIKAVFERKPLWDVSCKDYNKRHLINSLWDELATYFNSDRLTIRKRWKHLKDNYRVELRKLTSHSSRTGRSLQHKSKKWAHFDAMDFLRDVMYSRVPDDNSQTPNPSSVMCELSGNSSPKIKTEPNVSDEVYEVYEVIEVTECPNIEREEKNALHVETKECTPPNVIVQKPKAKKRKITSTKSSLLGIEKEKLEIEREKLKILKENRAIKSDGDYNFLISFLPHMKRLSELGNLKLRTEMSKVLTAVREEDLKLTTVKQEDEES